MEAAEREAHNVPVNYGTWDPSYIHARRVEEIARNGSNPYPSGPPTGDAMEDECARSNYEPQIYMQPAEAAQTRDINTWFTEAVASNKRWNSGESGWRPIEHSSTNSSAETKPGYCGSAKNKMQRSIVKGTKKINDA